MKHMLWLLKWVLKTAIFFTLFAFALNNQQVATVYFFFGTQWQSPLVLVVLSAFSVGVVVGVMGMMPGWLRQRSANAMPTPTVAAPPANLSPAPAGVTSYVDGL